VAGHIQTIVASYGYLAVFILIVLESLGIPLPGEVTLLAAAIYASTGRLQIEWVIVTAAVAASVGGLAGYTVGRTAGRAFVLRFGRYVFLNEEHLERAERFFARRGDIAVLVGRFIAFLRVFAALLAGINRMPLYRFALFNTLGAVVWAALYGVLAYELGATVFDRIAGTVGIGALVVVIVVGAAILLLRRRSARMVKTISREPD
jgi:membrane protein DedA with SNARE-associated domain